MSINRWVVMGIGLVMGALSGYGYWHYVGCMSGSCSITSSPVNSTVYGAVMGILFVNVFLPSKYDPEKRK